MITKNAIYTAAGGKKIQSDWLQSDSTKPDYIKNKPDISGTITRQIVETLPTEDIDPNCIYMIAKTDPDTGNYYDEWMYINNTWELIGNTAGGESDVFVVTVENSQIDCEYQDLVDAINAGKVINVISGGQKYIISNPSVTSTNLNLWSYRYTTPNGEYSYLTTTRFLISPSTANATTFNSYAFASQTNDSKPTATKYLTDTELQTKITNSQLSKGFIYFTTDTNKVYLATSTNTAHELTQVQSDWNQTDTTAPDYIKNKPTINPDWYGTQAEFDALTEYDESTNYHIETNPPSALPFKTYDKLIKWIKPEPFYFEDRTGNLNSVTVQIGSTPINYEYSTDNTTWTSQTTEANQSYGIIIPPNGKVYLRATANTWNGCNLSTTNFSNVGGNIMSLLYGANFDGQTSFPNTTSNFSSLFFNDTKLIEAHKLLLPATTLKISCYNAMFSGCTNLTTVPNLPATTLINFCYFNMFNSCRALTVAPNLNATTLAPSCYAGMFFGCSSLTSVKCLATDISASNCTTDWMNGVAANGTFTKDANMTDWTTGVNGIPSGWTVVNA